MGFSSPLLLVSGGFGNVILAFHCIIMEECFHSYISVINCVQGFFAVDLFLGKFVND